MHLQRERDPRVAVGAIDDSETLIDVLSNEARTTSTTELWVTTLGGAFDAALLQWQHPALGWLAAGCAAIGAYGAWGLLDRVVRPPGEAPPTDSFRVHLTALRDLVALAGGSAVAYAVFRFMANALANWNH